MRNVFLHGHTEWAGQQTYRMTFPSYNNEKMQKVRVREGFGHDSVYKKGNIVKRNRNRGNTNQNQRNIPQHEDWKQIEDFNSDQIFKIRRKKSSEDKSFVWTCNKFMVCTYMTAQSLDMGRGMTKSWRKHYYLLHVIDTLLILEEKHWQQMHVDYERRIEHKH